MSKNGRKVRERRSEYFGKLFDELGISFRRKASGEIDNTSPLRINKISLQIYFNEANSRWGAYLAANEAFYGGYGWSNFWLDAPVGKLERDYRKVVPIPGREHEALIDLVRYVKAIK